MWCNGNRAGALPCAVPNKTSYPPRAATSKFPLFLPFLTALSIAGLAASRQVGAAGSELRLLWEWCERSVGMTPKLIFTALATWILTLSQSLAAAPKSGTYTGSVTYTSTQQSLTTSTKLAVKGSISLGSTAIPGTFFSFVTMPIVDGTIKVRRGDYFGELLDGGKVELNDGTVTGNTLNTFNGTYTIAGKVVVITIPIVNPENQEPDRQVVIRATLTQPTPR